MRLLIADPTYSNPQIRRSEWFRDLSKEISEFSPDFQLDEADIGQSADWPMILVAFTSAFLLGKKIDENLDAWVEISRKFRRLFNGLRDRLGPVRVDETGATLLLIDHIANIVPEIEWLHALPGVTIPIPLISSFEPENLVGRENALYIVVLHVNGVEVFVAGVKSGGEMAFIQRFGSDAMSFDSDGRATDL